MDWKNKINSFFDEQERERQRQQQERERLERERQERERQEQERRNREIEEANWRHFRSHNFHCHVCGIASQKQLVEEHAESSFSGNSEGGGTTSYWTSYTNNWDLPGDLQKCDKCHEWTCKRDLHRGICKSCAEKM